MIKNTRRFDVIFNEKKYLLKKYASYLSKKQDYWFKKEDLDAENNEKLLTSKSIIRNLLNIPKDYTIIFSFGTTDSIEKFLISYLQKNKLKAFVITSWEHDAISSGINGLKKIYSRIDFKEIPLSLSITNQEILNKINKITRSLSENCNFDEKCIYFKPCDL